MGVKINANNWIFLGIFTAIKSSLEQNMQNLNGTREGYKSKWPTDKLTNFLLK